MEKEFWHKRWHDNQIGFHLPQPHALLSQYIQTLDLPKSSTVLVPLCGKTVDIGFLLQHGYSVIGIELSEVAVKALFNALKFTPTITQQGALKCYQSEQLTVYVGDIFDLNADLLESVDWIYDRAALVALPLPMREQYAKHIMGLSNCAPQLLVTIEYDQQLLKGPPFAINQEMVSQHYQQAYALQHIAQAEVEGGLKGQVDASEHLWMLTKNK